jgi:hypothetical protein
MGNNMEGEREERGGRKRKRGEKDGERQKKEWERSYFWNGALRNCVSGVSWERWVERTKLGKVAVER